jgi:hypothetical protein
LPKTITEPLFIPLTNNSKNVTPLGQNATVPIYNISSRSPSTITFDWYLGINTSFTCINLTMSNTSNKTNGIQINTSNMSIIHNLSWFNSNGIWMWADYSCNNTIPFRQTNFTYLRQAICVDCVKTSDINVIDRG